MKKRLSTELRKDQILKAAVFAATHIGFHEFTKRDVGNAAGCSAGLVGYYYETMSQLRGAVMRRAIDERVYSIVAQGVAMSHPCALSAPVDVINDSLRHMARENLAKLQACEVG